MGNTQSEFQSIGNISVSKKNEKKRNSFTTVTYGTFWNTQFSALKELMSISDGVNYVGSSMFDRSKPIIRCSSSITKR